MAYSGVTATSVLRYLNRSLGAVVQSIEISEEEMMRVVFQESMPTFSKFFPYKFNLEVKSNNLVEGRMNLYKIPNKDRLEIIGIHKVFLNNMMQYGSTMTPITSNPFSSQIFQDYASMTITPVTWEYYPPDEIQIWPRIVDNRSAMLEVKAYHPSHMRTIGIDMRDEFMRLCLLDVLVSLYPIRHRFESINSPYGSIQPFLDMVDRAESDRAELLERWRAMALRDSTMKKIFIDN